MKLKYYVIFSIVFMGAVGLYLYSLSAQDYTYMLPLSGFVITLPVAAWIVGIVGVFCVLTLIFFASAWLKDVIDDYHRKSDYDKLLTQINEQALNQPIKDRSFNRKAFGDLSKILQRFYLKPRLDSHESFNRKIDGLFEHYKDVMSGKIVNLKSYRLSMDNKFNLQNLKNKIQADYKSAFGLFNQAYPEEFKTYALLEILQNAQQKDFERALEFLPDQPNYKIAYALFDGFLKYPTSLDSKTLFDVCKKANFSAMDYIGFAKKSKGVFSPDDWIKLFETCADSDEKAEMAYFYVLFELEMLDRARERHKTHAKGEYLAIDAYLDLKESGKNYPFEIFIL